MKVQLQESSQSKLLHIGLSNQTRLIPDTLMTSVSEFVSPFRNCKSLIGNYVKFNFTAITRKIIGYVIGCETDSNGNYVRKFNLIYEDSGAMWAKTDYWWNGYNYKSWTVHVFITWKPLIAIEIKDNSNMQRIEAIQPNLTIFVLGWRSDWIEKGKIIAVNATNRWLEFRTFTRMFKLFNITTNENVQKNAASLPFSANYNDAWTSAFCNFMIVN